MESFRQLIFGNSDIPLIVEKNFFDKVPYIDPAFSGRLLANVTDTYASITFLPVNRADITYQVTLVSSSRETTYTEVRISVQCKCKRRKKTIYTLRTYIFYALLFLFASLGFIRAWEVDKVDRECFWEFLESSWLLREKLLGNKNERTWNFFQPKWLRSTRRCELYTSCNNSGLKSRRNRTVTIIHSSFLPSLHPSIHPSSFHSSSLIRSFVRLIFPVCETFPFTSITKKKLLHNNQNHSLSRDFSSGLS